MKELIFWKELMKVAQWPQKALSRSNQIWAATSGKRLRPMAQQPSLPEIKLCYWFPSWILENTSPTIDPRPKFAKVLIANIWYCSNTSRLEAHAGFIRLNNPLTLFKSGGIDYAYHITIHCIFTPSFGSVGNCIHHAMTSNKSWLIKNWCSKRFQMNMKKTVFVILLGFVALTKANPYSLDCKERAANCGKANFQEENMVCASNGKTYQNK